MPNHVHALIETSQTPLAEILRGWKSYTGKAANRLLERTGNFWQAEYFDRYIRDEEHFRKAMRYIENNPVKAGLVNRRKNGFLAVRTIGARTARPRVPVIKTPTRGRAARAPLLFQPSPEFRARLRHVRIFLLRVNPIQHGRIANGDSVRRHADSSADSGRPRAQKTLHLCGL